MSEIRKPRRYGIPKAPPKPKKAPRPGDSEAYLALVRQLPCAVDRTYGVLRMDPHHQNHLFPKRGKGTKVEDKFCIPLSRRRHDQLHKFETKIHAEMLLAWGIDGQALADELWSIYQDEDEPLEAMRAAVMNHEPGGEES